MKRLEYIRFIESEIKTMITTKHTVLIACLLSSMAFGQEKISVDIIPAQIHSGVIKKIEGTNLIGELVLHLDNMSPEVAAKVEREFKKYPEEVQTYAIDIDKKKIYISYTEPFYPNLVLSILDRVNIRPYYLENGEEVKYVKDGNAYFRN